MAYISTYEITDAAPAAIDIFLGTVVVFGLFSFIIGLVILSNWLDKHTHFRGNKR